VELDVLGLKVAYDAFAIALQSHYYKKCREKKGHTRNTPSASVCINTVITSSYNFIREILEKSVGHTFINIKSPSPSAMQSCVAVHFPIPPLAANRVQRDNCAASIFKSGQISNEMYTRKHTKPETEINERKQRERVVYNFFVPVSQKRII